MGERWRTRCRGPGVKGSEVQSRHPDGKWQQIRGRFGETRDGLFLSAPIAAQSRSTGPHSTGRATTTSASL